MSYYPDLSSYNFHHFSEQELNIGWLQKDQPFNIGEAPEGFLDKLKKYSEDDFIIFQTKGFHSCDYCQDNKFSSNEMRIVGNDGTVYASPYLIIHYIEAHKYLPPQEFIEAVMTGPIPDSEKYNETIKRLPEFWEQRRPDTNDEDYEEKFKQTMVDEISQSVDKQILNDILNKSPDFKKFIESYGKIMPAVYGMKNKNKKSE